MDYHLGQGLFVIAITLFVISLGLFLTRKPKWRFSEKILLALGSLSYLLDTIWWFFELHFPYTDLFFNYQGRSLQLTVFFVASFVFFLILFCKRLSRIFLKKP